MNQLPLALQITDEASVAPAEIHQRLQRGGPRLGVQLRDPELSAASLVAFGRALAATCRSMGAPLFVNDRLDIAEILDADGVHLGRRSVDLRVARAFAPGRRVTCSAHSVDEAVRLAARGADAVLLSPIFATPHKGPALGLAALTAARHAMTGSCRLFALGGVDAARAAACLAHGADGVASIRADLSGWCSAAAG